MNLTVRGYLILSYHGFRSARSVRALFFVSHCCHGHTGISLTQLTHDVRKVTEPDTKTGLKALPSFLVFPGMTEGMFSEQTQGLWTIATASPRIHIIRLSNGPALSFCDERYSISYGFSHVIPQPNRIHE